MSVRAKTSGSIQLAVATIVPLIVGIFAVRGTLVIGERYGMNVVPFVLVGFCTVLLGSAAWLNRAVLSSLRTLSSFVAAITVTLLVWLWQRLAFTTLVPHSGLAYGYFLKPEGIVARFWVLTCPFWVGLSCLLACLLAAVISAWRAGRRYSLAAIILWFLATFVVFSLPSMYLDAQGNASIFI